ncbi:MAG: trigger factor [Candidatus Moraniibacteriota bacterium]|nr:MAG: trigger factor [Candidatus Moranbacteria bacterium]
MTEIKNLPKSKIEVISKIPFSQWEKYIESAVKKFAQSMKIEGFRPGKAPREVIEQNVGQDAILYEAGEMAMKKHWESVIRENKLQVIGRPRGDIQAISLGNDLEYRIVTDVMPEVKMNDIWKEKVKDFVSKEKSSEKIDIDSPEVTKEINRLAQSRALHSVVEREAQEGDNVKLDFQVLVDKVPIEGGTSKDHAIILGSGVFIPGFEEKIIGMKSGEEKTFELAFPETYHAKHLAGKNATFEVKLNVVEQRELPEINDAFAISIGKFKDLSDLKLSISKGMTQEKYEREEQEKRSHIMDILLENVEMELPEILLEEELHAMLHDFEYRVTSSGISFEQYLQQVKKTREDISEMFKESAKKRVMGNLVFSEIAQEEKIEPSSQEIQTHMNSTLAQYGGVKDIEKKIDMNRLYALSRGELMNNKVWEILEKK